MLLRDPPQVEVAFKIYNDIRFKPLALSRTMMNVLVFICCKLRLRYSNVYHGVCGGSFEITFTVPETKGELQKVYRKKIIIKKKKFDTVKPLITNKSKEFIKCRILYFLIMECCRYLVFLFK